MSHLTEHYEKDLGQHRNISLLKQKIKRQRSSSFNLALNENPEIGKLIKGKDEEYYSSSDEEEEGEDSEESEVCEQTTISQPKNLHNSPVNKRLKRMRSSSIDAFPQQRLRELKTISEEENQQPVRRSKSFVMVKEEEKTKTLTYDLKKIRRSIMESVRDSHKLKQRNTNLRKEIGALSVDIFEHYKRKESVSSACSVNLKIERENYHIMLRDSMEKEVKNLQNELKKRQEALNELKSENQEMHTGNRQLDRDNSRLRKGVKKYSKMYYKEKDKVRRKNDAARRAQRAKVRARRKSCSASDLLRHSKRHVDFKKHLWKVKTVKELKSRVRVMRAAAVNFKQYLSDVVEDATKTIDNAPFFTEPEYKSIQLNIIKELGVMPILRKNKDVANFESPCTWKVLPKGDIFGVKKLEDGYAVVSPIFKSLTMYMSSERAHMMQRWPMGDLKMKRRKKKAAVLEFPWGVKVKVKFCDADTCLRFLNYYVRVIKNK